MPAFPTWYPRAKEILKILHHPDSPALFDRRAIERIFRVRKRQAIRILGDSGAYKFGQNFAVSRAKLFEYVEQAIKNGGAAKAMEEEKRAEERSAEVQRKLAAGRARFRTEAAKDDGLPAAIRVLAPGQLVIHYQDATDLLARITKPEFVS